MISTNTTSEISWAQDANIYGAIPPTTDSGNIYYSGTNINSVQDLVNRLLHLESVMAEKLNSPSQIKSFSEYTFSKVYTSVDFTQVDVVLKQVPMYIKDSGEHNPGDVIALTTELNKLRATIDNIMDEVRHVRFRDDQPTSDEAQLPF